MRARWWSALAVAVLSTTVPGEAQNVRIVERALDPRTDSLVDRIFKANAQEVHRMVAEWREREGQLIATLRTMTPDTDPSARRRLDEELMRNSREAFAMMRAIQDRCASERGPVPDGYIGVSLDTRVEIINGRATPSQVTVSSVEPGGPSQRAGIERNDRLLAIGGRDARTQIPEIGDLLIPGRTVVIRVERAGQARDIVVNVEPRPKGFAESCGELERALGPLRARAFTGVMRPRTGPGGVGGTGEARVEVGQAFERMRTESPDQIRLFVFNSGGPSEGYFAGAKFRSLTDDWREVLGVKQGVVVFDVAAGSVAARAGLKDGDVVTEVGDSPATDPMVFLQLLDVQERTEATLTVVRDKRSREVKLRWREP